MSNTFEAVCTETVYAFRGSSKLAQPSFIQGKIYRFTNKSITMQTHSIGNVSALNERGIESIMTTEHFNKHFQMI